MAKICLLKKFQIKASPDNVADILKYKASIMQLKVRCNLYYFYISYSFRYPKTNFAVQFFHILV